MTLDLPELTSRRPSVLLDLAPEPPPDEIAAARGIALAVLLSLFFWTVVLVVLACWRGWPR